MKKLVVIFLLISGAFTAQEINYSGSQNVLISVNPSFAGSNGLFRTQTIYGWSKDYFKTYTSCDLFLKKINAGIALTYHHDDSNGGLYKNDVFNFTYAQYFYLCDKQLKLVPSIQAGGFVRSYDRTKQRFEDLSRRYDDWVYWQTPQPAPQKSNFDISSGLLMQYKGLIIGTSVYHLTRPDMGLLGVQKMNRLYSAYASYNFVWNQNHLLNLSAKYNYQDVFSYIQLMAKAVVFKHYMIGFGAESINGLVFNVGFRHNYFNLSFTQTYNVNNKRTTSEVGAAFNLRAKEQRRELSYIENW